MQTRFVTEIWCGTWHRQPVSGKMDLSGSLQLQHYPPTACICLVVRLRFEKYRNCWMSYLHSLQMMFSLPAQFRQKSHAGSLKPHVHGEHLAVRIACRRAAQKAQRRGNLFHGAVAVDRIVSQQAERMATLSTSLDISVLTGPGAIAFTQIPALPSSTACCRVS